MPFEFFKKIKTALSKTWKSLGGKLRALFASPLTDETYAQLEQILYEADLGSAVTTVLLEGVKKFVRHHPDSTPEAITQEMQRLAGEMLSQPPSRVPQEGAPHVILVAGINGSGKTTTIAKLAAHYKEAGKRVLLAAADTFRAAAMDQLAMWAARVGVEVVKGTPGSDPSSVAFDALTAAKARGCDVVIVDTAGRLQNKTDLMHELKKICRVLAKVVPGAPHDSWLIVDATTGQNGVEQVRTFNAFTPLTGIVLTKLDGTAKGGVVLPIYHALQIPVVWVGVGEKIGDLAPFDQKSYLSGLFENPS